MNDSEKQPSNPEEGKPTEQPKPLVVTKKKASWFDVEFIGLFGVILPLVTLTVECFSHLCASAYVDPIPSWWHIFGVAFVAVANGVGWFHIMKGDCSARWLPFVTGASIGISIFYAAIFAPLVPVAVIMLVFFGIGALPLSPIFASLSGIRVAFIVKRLRKQAGTPLASMTFWSGIFAGIAFLLMAELPNAVTDIGLRQAVSPDPQQSRAGVRLIRTFGNEQSMLRNCYHHMASVSDIPSLLFSNLQNFGTFSASSPATVEQAREIYYRAYGRPFNSVTKPSFVGGRGFEEEDVWFYDPEIAGEDVGAKTGVKLANSDIVTSLNPDTATSYSEWTMVFSNQSYAQKEARMQIELPPGAVVSRATLWVNGEPREAAYGERGLVRRAYQSVVSRRRDPLLVTQVGPNKVMLQCFPVPPKTSQGKDGEIKVRIGITAPCTVLDVNTAQLVLPRISEHGFSVSNKHNVRVESPIAFTTSLKNAKVTQDNGIYRMYAEVVDASLRDEPISVSAKRNPNTKFFACAPLEKRQKFIVEELKPATVTKQPQHLYVVIDGSAPMAKYLPQIANTLAKIPAGLPTEIVFASDEISSLVDRNQQADLAKSLRELMHAPCVGGPNNLAAVSSVWREAAQRPDSAVMWIHGPQPVLYGGENALSAFEATNQFKPTLYDVEVYPGPNRLLEKLPRTVKVYELPRIGTLTSDLERLITNLGGGRTMEYVVARTTTEQKPDGTETVMPAISTQLVSLWAYDETLKLVSADKAKEAVKLAARHRLVTPVTGAVVLETAEDYKRNGIDPNNSDNNAESDPAKSSSPSFSIGAAPEPEEYALMFAALAVMAWHIRRARMQKRSIA